MRHYNLKVDSNDLIVYIVNTKENISKKNVKKVIHDTPSVCSV